MRNVKILTLAAFSLMMAGCMSNSGDQGTSDTERKVTTAILFAGTTPLAEPKVAAREFTCPTATTLEGTASYRAGGQESARGITYQAAIFDVARECKLAGNMLAMKVGVQGRVVLGENGKPGTFTVPVRVAVRRLEQTLYSKIHTAQVTVTESSGSFVVIDEGISLSLSANDPGDEFTVYVGIDPQGNRQQRQRRR